MDATQQDAVRRQRNMLLVSAGISAPLTVALWYGLRLGLPEIAGMDEPVARLAFAIRCACASLLFSLLLAIEAVSHERLFTPAIDPLAGRESRRMRINLRFLQNTLEQAVLFVPGLLALAWYCPDGEAMRAVPATAGTWLAARIVFWLAYHKGPQFRAAGLTGSALSMLVLLYVSARLGHELFGMGGAIAVLAVFGLAEVLLVYLAITAAGEDV